MTPVEGDDRWRDPETERSVLGDVLLHPEQLGCYRDAGLDVDHFSRPAHRLIWRAVSELGAERVPADPPAVRVRLSQHGTLDEVTDAYLFGLADGEPRRTPEGAAHLVTALDRCRRCRVAYYSSQQLIAQLAEDPRAIDNGAVPHFIETVSALAAGSGASVEPISQALSDFLTQHEHGSTRDELLPGLIARNETTLIHGAPRSMKTWATLEIGIALATGTPAFGILAPPAEARVLYVTNEDGAGKVSDRLRGLLAGRGFSEIPEGLRLVVGKGVWLDDDEWRRRLLDEVRQFEIDLVILDPLRSLTAAVDQGPREVQPFGNYLRRLIGETGCGVLCAHHDTKPQAGVSETRRRAQRASGGGLFGYMDAPINATVAGDGTTLLVPDGFKHADDSPPILFTLQTVDGGYRLVAETTTGKDPDAIELHAAITDYLRSSGGGSCRAITEAVSKNRRTVTRALEALLEAGEVDVAGGPRGARLWHLP